MHDWSDQKCLSFYFSSLIITGKLSIGKIISRCLHQHVCQTIRIPKRPLDTSLSFSLLNHHTFISKLPAEFSIIFQLFQLSLPTWHLFHTRPDSHVLITSTLPQHSLLSRPTPTATFSSQHLSIPTSFCQLLSIYLLRLIKVISLLYLLSSFYF